MGSQDISVTTHVEILVCTVYRQVGIACRYTSGS